MPKMKTDRGAAKRIKITKQGHEVLDQMVIVGRRLNLQILAGISERDVKTAERVLSKMKANIRDILAPLRLAAGDDDSD